MRSLIVRMRRDRAVYWPTAGTDRFGKPIYGSPAEIICRWEDQQREIRNPEGNVFYCKAIVYVDRPVVLKGLLYHGLLTDVENVERPQGIAGAFEIKFTKDTPNARNTETMRQAYL